MNDFDRSHLSSPIPKALNAVSRRHFIEWAGGIGASLLFPTPDLGAADSHERHQAAGSLRVDQLPRGRAPAALSFGHFPDRLHAFVWRNWLLVPAERMAAVVGATPDQILTLGRSMGLSGPPLITPDQRRRSYLTVIRRNWHLLPYEQLLQLLEWTPEQMAFTLREDDFLFVKLGNLKPECPRLLYTPSDRAALAREKSIAALVHEAIPVGLGEPEDRPFGFVDRLSQRPSEEEKGQSRPVFTPGFCYSYFALYGDPLLETETDPYPDGYLERLGALGLTGVWLQGVLHKLAPFPWDSAWSNGFQARLKNLRQLAKRAARQGLGIYLYLNEPRAMPLTFYEPQSDLKGVTEGAYATLCTSQPAVQDWMVDAVAGLCRAVPELSGLFTITASENLTNCWSHGHGAQCPRCAKRNPSDVIAEVNTLVARGIRQSGQATQLIAWDWGWADTWAESAIRQLPAEAALMSVSEWSIPIRRGGVTAQVGEYSISTVGPGPRAQKHWRLARERGLKTVAKIQAGNTWELSAVPYIPALENVARHAANLVATGIDGVMFGWTLGGYPSPNLEIVGETARLARERKLAASATSAGADLLTDAMMTVATRRFGAPVASAVVEAWRQFSRAFSEFPFDGGVVYTAPMQFGPSNLLWSEPTGFPATMVGFPYDDLDSWRGPYPADVFVAQLETVAQGFEKATAFLRGRAEAERARLSPSERQRLSEELTVAEAAGIHFRSTANQASFIMARRALTTARSEEDAQTLIARLEQLLRSEKELATRLSIIQRRDSRIGFEASNQYYYVPVDLLEKALNCQHLLANWLPQPRSKK